MQNKVTNDAYKQRGIRFVETWRVNYQGWFRTLTVGTFICSHLDDVFLRNGVGAKYEHVAVT